MEQLESQKIGQRYAKALFDAASEQGDVDTIAESLDAIAALYDQQPDVGEYFAHPMIAVEEKQALVDKHFKKAMAPLVTNLLGLLLENQRMMYLPQVIESFEALKQQRDGVVTADVYVPIAIDAKLQDKFRDTLQTCLGYNHVELNVVVKPSLLGGATVKVGDRFIEGCYHSKFDKLRRQIG